MAGQQQQQAASSLGAEAVAETGWICLSDGDSGLMILEHHAGCAHHPSKHASQPAETGKIHDAEVPVRSAIDTLAAVIGRLRKKGRALWARAPWSVWPAVKRGPLCTDPDLLLAFFSTTCLLLLQRNPPALGWHGSRFVGRPAQTTFWYQQ